MAERFLRKTVHADGSVLFETAGFPNIIVRPDDLAPDTRIAAIGNGIAQKVGDAAALPAGATPAEKYQAMREVADRLSSGGPWNSPDRDGAGTLLVRALVECYGLSKEQARAELEGKTKRVQDAMLAELESDPEFAPIVKRLRGATAPDAADAARSALAALRRK